MRHKAVKSMVDEIVSDLLCDVNRCEFDSETEERLVRVAVERLRDNGVEIDD